MKNDLTNKNNQEISSPPLPTGIALPSIQPENNWENDFEQNWKKRFENLQKSKAQSHAYIIEADQSSQKCFVKIKIGDVNARPLLVSVEGDTVTFHTKAWTDNKYHSLATGDDKKNDMQERANILVAAFLAKYPPNSNSAQELRAPRIFGEDEAFKKIICETLKSHYPRAIIGEKSTPNAADLFKGMQSKSEKAKSNTDAEGKDNSAAQKDGEEQKGLGGPLTPGVR